ncbi:MAG: ribonuclease Z [Chloroflexota bacterium]|nr:ribonuclease Z [Chloroflexota bacterium]
MFELVFLGTSASAPSTQRGLSSAMVLYREYRFMIDCGEGTQRQLLQSGLGFRRLDTILLTHGHLDHILGLGGLASTMARWEATDSLTIYGGRWALERVADLIFGVVLRGAQSDFQIDLVDVHPGALMEDENFTLSAFPVTHRGPGCFGYTFEEKPKRPFLVERAEQLGVPPSPKRRRLVQGRSITLDNGRVIHPEEVLGAPIPGAKLVFVGDASRVGDLVESASGADALVIEATYVEEERELAAQHGHITAAQAAWLAREAGVEQLILTHISRRYPDHVVLREAQRTFPNTIIAQDFDRFRIQKER